MAHDISQQKHALDALELAFSGLPVKLASLDLGEVHETNERDELSKTILGALRVLVTQWEHLKVTEFAKELRDMVLLTRSLPIDLRATLVPAHAHFLLRTLEFTEAIECIDPLWEDVFILFPTFSDDQQHALIVSWIYFSFAIEDQFVAEEAFLLYLCSRNEVTLAQRDASALKSLVRWDSRLRDDEWLEWFDQLVGGVRGRLFRHDLEAALFSACGEVTAQRIKTRLLLLSQAGDRQG